MNRRCKLATLALVVSLLASCQMGTKNNFVAEGKIANAEGEMLYLEEVGTGNVLSLDSVRLDATGAFRFAYAGMSYPMFYRLRVGGNSIPFAADSLTQIKIEADATNLFGSYTLKEADKYNHQIKDISQRCHYADRSVDSLLGLYNSGVLGLVEVRAQVDSVVSLFKQDLVSRYIYVDPKSPAAYYALFQRKGGEATYFSVDDEGDDRAFAAVATAYTTYYPNAPYTPFLKDMALRAVALNRARRAQREAQSADSLRTPIPTIAFPEIKLKDRNGEEQSLTTLAKEGAVLLSFTAYSAQWSPSLVATLRALVEKKPELKIYEVSVDGDTYYWQNASRTLPWISVNDADHHTLLHYNVQSLPAFYLIKGGELKRLNHPNEAI